MEYHLTDHWMVTAIFKSSGLGSSDALDKLMELTVSFYISTVATYSTIRQIARKILKDRLKMEDSQLKHLVLSTLTLAKSGE